MLGVLKEDYEVLTEKLIKTTKIYDEMVQGLKQELYELKDKQKDLQDFYYRHDSIFQEERNANIKQIKEINETRDKIENTLTKKLNTAQ